MDEHVRRTVARKPCKLLPTGGVNCPFDDCKAVVEYCPRYGATIKRHQMNINEAKERIIKSREVKELTRKAIDDLDIPAMFELLDNVTDDRVLPSRTSRLLLGAACVLYKCRLSLGKLTGRTYAEGFATEAQLVVDAALSRSRTMISLCVCTLYRHYLLLHIRRLLGFIRGSKFSLLEKCREQLDVGSDWTTTWKNVKYVNRKLRTDFSSHQKDGIDDYLVFLNDMFDVELTARFTSNWMCCSKGTFVFFYKPVCFFISGLSEILAKRYIVIHPTKIPASD